MLLSLASAVIALYIAYSIRWRIRILRTFARLNIPGPPPDFLLGNAWEVYKYGHLAMQRKWHEQYGPVVGYYLGLNPILLVADIELQKNILFKDFHNFTDRPVLLDSSLLEGFENSVLTIKGARWKRVRATLTPSFTAKKLKQIDPMMNSCVDAFMQKLDEDSSNSSECEIYEHYQSLTLDTICKIGMGLDLKIQKHGKYSKYLKAAKAILNLPVHISMVLGASFPLLLDLFGRIGIKLRFAWKNGGWSPVGAFKDPCKEVVKLRRLNPTLYGRPDLLQLMMDARGTSESSTNFKSFIVGDTAEELEAVRNAKSVKTADGVSFAPDLPKPKRLKDSEVIDTAFLLLLAGYETTSSSLAFITKMLLRFPELQERLRAELMEATDGGKAFDFERLQRCEYTEAFIQETLRMYPPVYFLSARVAAEEVVYGKIVIPKGMTVVVSVNELHYNEAVFPRAEEFRPERFLPKNKTPAMVASYQPFGAGPRNCIGMRFAQMEIKITVAKMLTKYRISSVGEPRHDPSIRTVIYTTLQQIKDPLKCELELLQE